MTTQIASLVTSKSGLLSIATGLVWIFTALVPVLPPVWGNLVTAVLGVLAFYHIGNAVTGARSNGTKGI